MTCASRAHSRGELYSSRKAEYRQTAHSNRSSNASVGMLECELLRLRRDRLLLTIICPALLLRRSYSLARGRGEFPRLALRSGARLAPVFRMGSRPALAE